jgi:hypothetical protein
VFWVPPKQNPEVLMRQMMQGGGNGAQGGVPPNPDGTPGTPGNPIIVNPGGGAAGNIPGGGQ